MRLTTKTRLVAMALLVGLFAAGHASAETTKDADPNRAATEAMTNPDRYELKVLDNGQIARVDKQTGSMSLCDVTGGTMVCRLAVDERDAYETEIERLRARLDQGNDETTKTETVEESEFSKALEFSEKAMRRFFGVIQDLRREYDETQ